MRPLYKSLAQATRGPDGHAGLWYDKLCDQWTSEEDKRGRRLKVDKLPWIKQLTQTELGAARHLQEAVARVHRLVNARGGKLEILTTTSRFVTGLGRSNPIENGFTWHPTLGVPYLPGSSIEGVVRAWAREVGDADDATIDRLFGKHTDPLTCGDLIFLDALPLRPVRLEADVMTPHFANWTTDDPPGDWRSPVPVPFLVVAANTPFAFSILARCGALAGVELAHTWLRDALSNAGAGAKTAVGYGRFEYDAKATQLQYQKLEAERAEAAKAQRRAVLEGTPVGAWLLELEEKREADVLEDVRKHIKAPPTDPAARQAFARAVTQLPYFKHWLTGKTVDVIKSAPGPDKLKERARAIAADAK